MEEEKKTKKSRKVYSFFSSFVYVSRRYCITLKQAHLLCFLADTCDKKYIRGKTKQQKTTNINKEQQQHQIFPQCVMYEMEFCFAFFFIVLFSFCLHARPRHLMSLLFVIFCLV